MSRRHEITKEQVVELEAVRKKNKNKNVEKRLKALVLFAGGHKREEIAKQTGFAKSYILDSRKHITRCSNFNAFRPLLVMYSRNEATATFG